MSGNLTLVLDRREMLVSMDGKTIKVEQPNAEPQRLPLGLLGQVVVHGNPMVSCDVWRALAEHGVAAILFPSRGSGDAAWLGAGISSSVMVRLAQHRAYNAPAMRLNIARWIVQQKLSGQCALLRALAASKPSTGIILPTGVALQALRTIADQAETTILSQSNLLENSRDNDTLMGREGAAAEAWFRFLAGLLPAEWQFFGRNRRPPKDPVNALLSLSYTLVYSEAGQVVRQRGLDPCVGYLHVPVPGRDSLTLDVMEPLRPGADAFVLGLLGHILEPSHFSTNDRDGCRLNKEGRKKYYAAWAERRLAWQVGPSGIEKDADDKDLTLTSHCQLIIRNLTTMWRDLEAENGTTS